MEYVSIPDTVVTIGSNAFTECSMMNYLVIGNGVVSIGESAFNGCRSLKSLVIPQSVSAIYMWAFRYCEALSDLTIPANVMYIGANAFGKNGTSRRSITFQGRTFNDISYMTNYPWGVANPGAELNGQIETVHSRGVNVLKTITQAQYDELAVKDSDTMYIILDI